MQSPFLAWIRTPKRPALGQTCITNGCQQHERFATADCDRRTMSAWKNVLTFPMKMIPAERRLFLIQKIIETGVSESPLSSMRGESTTVVELLILTTLIEDKIHEARREVMTSSSHLVEIDLRRDGDHLHVRELLPQADDFVHVFRKDRWPKGYVWPIQLLQRLPVIAIPLKEDDADVDLDLQVVLATAYDRAASVLEIDYRSEPTPCLGPVPAEWSKLYWSRMGFGDWQGAMLWVGVCDVFDGAARTTRRRR